MGSIAGRLVLAGAVALFAWGEATAASLEKGGAWGQEKPDWARPYAGEPSVVKGDSGIRVGDWTLTAAPPDPEIWDAAIPAAGGTTLSPGGYVALSYSDWRLDVSGSRYSLSRGQPLSVFGLGVGYEWKPSEEVAIKVGPRSRQSFTPSGAETDVGLALAATLQFTPRWAVTGTASVTQGLTDSIELSEQDTMRASRFTTGLFFSFRF